MKKILCMGCILCAALLCGCGSTVKKHEITDLAIVMAVGLDAAENGDIHMTLLVQSSTGAQGSRLYAQSGKTLLECLQKATEACDHIPFFGHTEMVFIGGSLWDKDVCAKLDWFVRSSRLRQECTVNALREGSAADFLAQSLSGDLAITDAVRAVYDSESLYRLSEDSRVASCMQFRHDPSVALVLPCLQADTTPDGRFVPRLSSYLILCEGKPVTLLEKQAALGLHLLRGETGTMRILVQDALGAPATVETQSIHVAPRYQGIDPLRVQMAVEVEYHVLEYHGTQDPSTEPALSEIQKSVEETVLTGCEQALDVMCKGGADAIGLSELTRHKDALGYQLTADRWRQVMQQAQITVTAQARFIHSNQLGRPLGAKETA